MSSILYYSNYCDKCKNILREIGNSEIKSEDELVVNLATNQYFDSIDSINLKCKIDLN